MFLIVNLGLKSIRIIVYDGEGNIIFSSSRPVQTFIYENNVEQDPETWIELLEDLLFELKNRTSLIPSICSITVTTSSSCILGLGSDATPLTKVLMVSDKRTVDQVAQIKKLESFKKLEVSISTSYIIPKILWFKDNSSAFSQIITWVGAGDFLNYYFSSCLFTDTLNASKAFYKDGIGYPTLLLKDLGLDESILPTVKHIGHTVEINSKIKSKYGFKDDCNLVLTTYDAICAVLGSNNSFPNNACDVSGTVTSVRMLIDEKDLCSTNNTDKGSLLIQKIDLIKKYIVGASNNMGGGLIEWLKQAFYDENDPDVYYRIENDATKSSIGASGIIFMPYLLGERAPFVSNNIRAEFIGINRSCKRYDFSRAVFESSAFVTKDLLSLLNQYEPSSLSVSGGLARFDLINQIKADVTGLPVYVVNDFESTSIGALLLSILALNKSQTYEDVSSMLITIRKIINPNKKNTHIYSQFYNFYIKHRDTVIESYDHHATLCKLLESFTSKSIRNL